jgi:DNA-directed RNA polymerase subunit RPC12/RpoP
MKEIKRRTSRCPSCSENISIGERPQIGQYFLCSNCDEKVEVIKLDPIMLDLIYIPDESDYHIEDYEYWDTYWARA